MQSQQEAGCTILLFQYTLNCPGDKKEWKIQPVSLLGSSELLQGPSALQSGGDGQGKSLKDGVMRTLVAAACMLAKEQGGITGFNNWRLTYSKTPSISLKTNHLESKAYIAYLGHRNTFCGQKLR